VRAAGGEELSEGTSNKSQIVDIILFAAMKNGVMCTGGDPTT
jgi:hypothetical protein